MHYSKKSLSLLSVATIALFASLSQNSIAASNVDSWVKVCRTQDGDKVCNIVSDIVTDYGQPLTIVNLVETAKEKKILITVPTDRHIPEGISMQIGKEAVKKLDYSFCLGAICLAQGQVDDSMINSMKTADNMRLISVDYQGISTPIDLPLKGFAAAYKSTGITEAEFNAARNKRAEARMHVQLQGDQKLLDAQQAAKRRK